MAGPWGGSFDQRRPDTILKTTDGGSSWVEQDSGTLASLTSVYFVDAQHGWTVGARNNAPHLSACILATTDGGASWQLQYEHKGMRGLRLFSVRFGGRIYGLGGWRLRHCPEHDSGVPQLIALLDHVPRKSPAQSVLTWSESPEVIDTRGVTK